MSLPHLTAKSTRVRSASQNRLFLIIAKVAGISLPSYGALIAGMYLTDKGLQKVLALVFSIAASLGVLIWIWSNVKQLARTFRHHSTPGNYPIAEETEGVQSTLDQLAAATQSQLLFIMLAGYLLLALAYACAYHALQATTASTLLDNLYYSIVTLATVGYGDLVPAGFGRVIACIEMLSGLAYQILAIGGGTAYLMTMETRGVVEK